MGFINPKGDFTLKRFQQMITYTVSGTDEEIAGILTLQQANLPRMLSNEEMQAQGFVTVTHSIEELTMLNGLEQHVIAKDGERVIGYVLAMTKASKTALPVLVPMFELFDEIAFRGKPVSAYQYLVVGQVCVAKDYRGQGVFDRLYQTYKNRFKDKYDFAVTEIAVKNLRSNSAHQRIGFEEIHQYLSPDNVEWNVVLWDWNR